MSLKSTNPTFAYLGANAHKELVHQLLAMDPGIRFIDSAIYPEQQQSRFEDKLSKESVIAFDSRLAIGSGEIGFTPVNGCNQVKVIDSVM